MASGFDICCQSLYCPEQGRNPRGSYNRTAIYISGFFLILNADKDLFFEYQEPILHTDEGFNVREQNVPVFTIGIAKQGDPV